MSEAGKDAANKKWSETSDLYVRYFEPHSNVLGRYLLNGMKLLWHDETSLQILEAGAGAGGLARELCHMLDDSDSKYHLWVTDNANGMLEKSRQRLEGRQHVTVEHADYTAFTYPDEKFDRYYANLCLHYASDPDAVLGEANRVLKPGGIAGFSVWGRKQDSPVMTIVPDVLDEFNLKKKDPQQRSSFHMGEDDAGLRQQFRAKGFDKCTIMHIPIAMEFLDAAGYVDLILNGAGSTKKLIETFSPEDQKRVKDEIYSRSKSILDEGSPVSMDMAVIVAQKKLS